MIVVSLSLGTSNSGVWLTFFSLPFVLFYYCSGLIVALILSQNSYVCEGSN